MASVTKNPVIITIGVMALVLMIFFFMLAFGVVISTTMWFVIGGFLLFGLLFVVYLILKNPPEESMKAAIIFLRAWWKDVFKETLEEREIYLVTRYYGNEKFYGATVRKGSGSTGQKMSIVLRKNSGGFSVEKCRATANFAEEANPFLGFQTEYDTGAPIPHIPSSSIPRPSYNSSHDKDNRAGVNVNIGKQEQEEEKGG